MHYLKDIEKGMLKTDLLSEHFNSYKSCFPDNEVVPGCGNPEARVLLIGEAPGKDEVRLSRPFAGKAGRYLDEFLGLIGISRDNIYITNTIKYRLAKTDPRTGRVSNRPAARDEIEQSRTWLLKEIDILKPEYIVTLGNVPLRAVTGDNRTTIGSVHGKAAALAIGESSYWLYALYHPASIIYNRSLKDIYINDIKGLKRLLTYDGPVTELIQPGVQPI